MVIIIPIPRPGLGFYFMMEYNGIILIIFKSSIFWNILDILNLLNLPKFSLLTILGNKGQK